MTELEAVNEILQSIGQAPVNTLNVTGITDVSNARSKLITITRRVLTYGFNFNTDSDWEILPDADGVILVPSGALKIESQDITANLVERLHPTKGRAVWDKDNRTWEFTAPVSFKITWGFSFEELPETARCYVATAAAQQFQARIVGSRILNEFTKDDADNAWVLLIKEERASRPTNLFRTNASMAKLTNRRY